MHDRKRRQLASVFPSLHPSYCRVPGAAHPTFEHLNITLRNTLLEFHIGACWSVLGDIAPLEFPLRRSLQL